MRARGPVEFDVSGSASVTPTSVSLTSCTFYFRGPHKAPSVAFPSPRSVALGLCFFVVVHVLRPLGLRPIFFLIVEKNKKKIKNCTKLWNLLDLLDVTP